MSDLIASRIRKLVEIAQDFWCEHHYGQTLKQWEEQGIKTEVRKVPKSGKKPVKTQEKPVIIKQISRAPFDKTYPNITRRDFHRTFLCSSV